MNTRYLRWFLLLTLATLAASRAVPADGSVTPVPVTDRAALQALAQQLASDYADRRNANFQELQARRDGPLGRLNNSPGLQLLGVDGRRRPLYYLADNLNAARTIATNRLWPSGPSGLALTGENSAGTLALWDTGAVLVSHQELTGRVELADDPSSTSAHATHIAGTLIASGVLPTAHGMSPAGRLTAFDWLNDEAEMASAAADSLRISNHSYGVPTGWYCTPSAPFVYYWFGDVTIDPDEDPGFGYYSQIAHDWDEIAYLAPYYLIFKSAGNDRDDQGPEPGEGHYYWDPDALDYVWSTETRAPDGGATGVDTLPYHAVAKNVVTVGAVADIPGGYGGPEDVQMSAFSSWGPTDDGRIKPDIVTNGVALESCIDTGVGDYAMFNGTSMAAPGAAGSANLILQHYLATHAGTPLRSATLKALLIHTSDEAGEADGPDYAYGWGLLNSETAVALISADSSGTQQIREELLVAGAADTFTYVWNGRDPVKVTLAWTDPPGDPPLLTLDPLETMLVHDLDLRLEQVSAGTQYLPWVLDPALPDAPATTGDNVRDNVEQVRVASPDSGTYRVIVQHKGVLVEDQFYSFVQNGLVPPPPVAPVVTGLMVVQRRDGSGLVDISFDLLDPDSPLVTVTVTASRDGGITWDLPVITVDGDVGAGVAAGPGKLIVWDFALDNPGLFLPDCVVKVSVSDE